MVKLTDLDPSDLEVLRKFYSESMDYAFNEILPLKISAIKDVTNGRTDSIER